MSRKIDFEGRRFARLTVTEEVGRAANGAILWRCVCDCGNSIDVISGNLTNGNTRSCGCLRTEMQAAQKHRTTHGASYTKEYKAFIGAKSRCRIDPKYLRYGIKFRFKNFEEFFAELGVKPSPAHSVDRINTAGHYEPGNVRWATYSQQNRNRRRYAGYKEKWLKNWRGVGN